MAETRIEWRGEIDNGAINELHAEAFSHGYIDDDWKTLVARHSLGWVVASDEHGVVGFLNVPWDGAAHAWLQDVIVAKRRRGEGVGKQMIELATSHARWAGCEWLHVDFEPELSGFYIDGCGFAPSRAGLIRL